ncbi:hypothetical protein T484DRAFT_1742444 [Baffinella frigidus]|nr:hypothetical protein T484DRAFT_1742444 [Cryptophyta sp. CCMP2293]
MPHSLLLHVPASPPSSRSVCLPALVCVSRSQPGRAFSSRSGFLRPFRATLRANPFAQGERAHANAEQAGKVGKKRALGEYEDLEENDFKKLRGMTNSHGAQLFYRSTLEGIVAPRIAKREADHVPPPLPKHPSPAWRCSERDPGLDGVGANAQSRHKIPWCIRPLNAGV